MIWLLTTSLDVIGFQHEILIYKGFFRHVAIGDFLCIFDTSALPCSIKIFDCLFRHDKNNHTDA